MSAAPLILVLEVTRYVRTQAGPVTTAAATQAAGTTTQKAGAALTIARQRGYITGRNGTWTPGPIEPGGRDDALKTLSRRHQGHARKPRRPSNTRAQ